MEFWVPTAFMQTRELPHVARLLDDAYALMPEDAPRRAGRNVTFEDMEVSAADGGFRHPDDGVGRILYGRNITLLERFLVWPFKDESFHCFLRR